MCPNECVLSIVTLITLTFILFICTCTLNLGPPGTQLAMRKERPWNIKLAGWMSWLMILFNSTVKHCFTLLNLFHYFYFHLSQTNFTLISPPHQTLCPSFLSSISTHTHTHTHVVSLVKLTVGSFSTPICFLCNKLSRAKWWAIE